MRARVRGPDSVSTSCGAWWNCIAARSSCCRMRRAVPLCEFAFRKVSRLERVSAFPSTLAVVEDDRDYAEYLAQFLRQHDVAVTVFNDSDEFLTSPGAFEFDFYVIDLMLPGVDGVDLVRLIRRKGP